MPTPEMHTPGESLCVQIASTCSGAWPVIVQRCIDPETKEEWFREIAETPTAFVERGHMVRDKGKYGAYNEAPGRFKKHTYHAESVANAHLFAGAADLLKAMRSLLDELECHGDGSYVLCSRSYFNASEAVTAAQDAINKATTITSMEGGD